MKSAIRRASAFTGLSIVTLALAGCEKGTYEVKGEGKATVTYKDGQMKTEKDVTLPWKKDVTGLSEYSLKASGAGKLECSITRPSGVQGETAMGECSAASSK